MARPVLAPALMPDTTASKGSSPNPPSVAASTHIAGGPARAQASTPGAPGSSARWTGSASRHVDPTQRGGGAAGVEVRCDHHDVMAIVGQRPGQRACPDRGCCCRSSPGGGHAADPTGGQTARTDAPDEVVKPDGAVVAGAPSSSVGTSPPRMWPGPPGLPRPSPMGMVELTISVSLAVRPARRASACSWRSLPRPPPRPGESARRRAWRR